MPQFGALRLSKEAWQIEAGDREKTRREAQGAAGTDEAVAAKNTGGGRPRHVAKNAGANPSG
jgi:hypothetical protein